MHSNRPAISILVALCAALALCAGTALAKRSAGPAADPSFQPSEDQKAVHTIKRQIAAEELARALQLSDEQKLAIASLIKEVQAAKVSGQAARRAAAPQMRALMEDYLDEVRSSGAASEATLADIRALHQGLRPDRSGKGERRKEIKGKLQELLSDTQRQSLRDFRPMAALHPKRAERASGGEHEERASGAREGSEHFEGERGERKERRKARRHKFAQRHKAKGTVRDVLLSAEMLDVLQR